MLAVDILQNKIEPLRADQTIGAALHQMDDLNVRMLPVVDKTTNKLIGQIRRARLEEAEDQEAALHTLELEEPQKVFEGQHIFEAIRTMLQYEIRMLPVVDQEMTYSGVVCRKAVLESLTELLNLAEIGSIITIEMEQRDYTLSEIVRLIESEGAKILGMAVETPNDQSGRFRVSVKLNLQDISHVTATLRRHEYHISTETSSEMHEIDFQARAGELLRYLDM